ncbi:hypothetical protein ACGFXB_37805 [Streptomyces canus]|uniref:hypothetical protein n=1 Tax=Streptomyces canus TaxID=58343 RepID=UPI0037121A9F
MRDGFKREKYAHLPRSLAAGGEPRSSYEIGNIAYFRKYDDAFKKYDDAVAVTIEAVD